MIFEIKKDSHRATIWDIIPNLCITSKNILSFNCKFNTKCVYDFGTLDNYDCNKLYGLSTSYNHMVQSARIGWRCIDNESIEIMTFVHDNGTFLEPQILGIVKPNEWFTAKIEIKNDMFSFYFESKNIENDIDVKISKIPYKLKYKLFPYFGGNRTAPKTMLIEIHDID